MPSFKCRGVDVEFPFEPYECQKNYMSKVIECLQTSQNGILESPTGTGKTVSLLCSTLAWRRMYVATQELGRCIRDDGLNKAAGGEGTGFRQELSKDLKEGATGSGWGEVQEGNFVDRPRIIYASRTHSQLSQAVDQLKDTAYRPRVSIIGSREQLCIHPEVLKQDSNAGKVHMCRAKVDNRMCHFHNNLEHKKGEKAFSEGILDIEDLVKLGNKHKVCPYYMARELKTSADIVFMPYNYLLDAKARRIHGVDLSGSIIIFDEAHNVERICEESASFELSSADLASCISETDQLLTRTVEVEELNKDFRDDNAAEGDFVPKELCEMKMIFMDLEKYISAIDIPASGTGVTKPGGFIFEIFAKAKVTFDKRGDIMSLVEKMISHLTSNSTGYQNKAAGLQKFLDVMNIMYSRDTQAMSGHNQASLMSSCYKVHIRGADANKKKKQRTDLWTSSKQPSADKKVFVLSYWCFSPGFSMQELVSQGVRSIILTSGTLAPLTSFKSELRIDFPIQLENPHVIERHQMQVGIVTRGPDKTVLNSSYQTRFNRDYILSLGNAIVNFARIVPNGLLVFFPSYPVMNHCLEIWQEDGISSRISQYKQMFIEPKGKVDFVEAMEGFYEKVRDPTLNGASFFAVCRGKVSEGLDFADMNGRAVVITGLPFPPRMDPRVSLKMQYLDEMRRKNSKYLSGQEWYRQQASRAVNQAIGRVIRHKEDYGAILLCDTRFTSKDSRAQLPLWLRPYVNEYSQFGHAVRDLTIFFKVAEKKMPAPKVKKPRDTRAVMYETESSEHMAGPSNRQPAMRARELDSHVRSLKRNRDGSHVSEDQLKSMYEDTRPKTSIKSKGLLDALSNAEGSRSAASGFLFDDALREQTNVLRNNEEPRKRKRIVIKERGFESAGDDKAAGTKAAGTSSDASMPAKKKFAGETVLSAEIYINEVKRIMSDESYENFSALIRAYKKTCDLNTLVSNLTDLFVDDPSRHYLIRNFYTFVRPNHKKEFDSICQCVTGKGCGFKPEHAIPRKKLERHRESAATSKVKVADVASKTKDGEQSKSTASASITSLNTDSHLNQGNLQTTHNASDVITTDQGKGVAEKDEKSKSSTSASVTSLNTDSHLNQGQHTHNASKGVPTEPGNNHLDLVKDAIHTDEKDNSNTDTSNSVGDTINDDKATSSVSHSVSDSDKISKYKATNVNTDGSHDEQSIVGMNHNTTVHFDMKRSATLNSKEMKSCNDHILPDSDLQHPKQDVVEPVSSETYGVNCQPSNKLETGKQNASEMSERPGVNENMNQRQKLQLNERRNTESANAEHENQSTVKENRNQRENPEQTQSKKATEQMKTTEHKDAKQTESTKRDQAQSQQVKMHVKKKQTSLMDMFKIDPKEDTSSRPDHRRKKSSTQTKVVRRVAKDLIMSQTPDREQRSSSSSSQRRQHGSSSGGSQRKQKVFRKVLIPETPDKGEKSDEISDGGEKCNGSQEPTCQEHNSSSLSLSSGDIDMEGYMDVIAAGVHEVKRKWRDTEGKHSEEGQKLKRKLSLVSDDDVDCGDSHERKFDDESSDKEHERRERKRDKKSKSKRLLSSDDDMDGAASCERKFDDESSKEVEHERKERKRDKKFKSKVLLSSDDDMDGAASRERRFDDESSEEDHKRRERKKDKKSKSKILLSSDDDMDGAALQRRNLDLDGEHERKGSTNIQKDEKLTFVKGDRIEKELKAKVKNKNNHEGTYKDSSSKSMNKGYKEPNSNNRENGFHGKEHGRNDSSKKTKFYHEHKPSQKKSDHEYKSSQRKSDHEHKSSQRDSAQEHKSSQRNSDSKYQSLQTKSDREYNSSQRKFNQEHMSSRRKSDHEYKSSQRKSDLEYKLSQTKSDHEYKSSQRKSQEHIKSSQRKSDHEHKSSQRKPDHEYKLSQKRSDHEYKSSHRKSDQEHKSSQRKFDHENKSSHTKSDCEYKSSQKLSKSKDSFKAYSSGVQLKSSKSSETKKHVDGYKVKLPGRTSDASWQENSSEEEDEFRQIHKKKVTLHDGKVSDGSSKRGHHKKHKKDKRKDL